MTRDELQAWRGMPRLAWILRLDEVLAIRPPPPRKGAKRPRVLHSSTIVPGDRAVGAPQNPASNKRPPPEPLPRPTKHHSSGSGHVDQFFAREEVSRGHGGAGVPRVAADSGGHRGNSRRDTQRGGGGYRGNGGGGYGDNGGFRSRDYDRGGARGGDRWHGGSCFVGI